MAITVTIPTYNRKDSVIRLIKSIAPQLRENDEILVLDDASPDQTTDALSGFNRVRAVRNSANLGMVKNWNQSIRLALNPWICVVHDDDEVVPDALQTIRKAMEFVGGRPCAIFGGDSKTHDGEPFRLHYSDPGQYAILHAPRLPSGTTVHKDVFDACGYFDEGLLFSPDLEFFPRVARAFPIAVIESPTVVRYRFHESNYQYKTWRDPMFLAQLEAIARRVGGYAGLTGSDLQTYITAQMTDALSHMMLMSRRQNDLEVYRKTSRLLFGNSKLGRRAKTMAIMGTMFGWCPRSMAGHSS